MVLITEVTKYAIVGGICTVLDISVLYSLTSIASVNYLVASVLSFLSGAALNYTLSTFWVFDFRRFKKRAQELSFYIAITSIVLAFNILFIYTITEIIKLHYMASKAISLFIVFGLNFTLRKYLLHKEYNAK